MLDDLREQANSSEFFEEDDGFDYSDMETEPEPSSERFLGMTPPQRFVIAIMILLMVCIMGSFLLLVTEKIVLPFV